MFPPTHEPTTSSYGVASNLVSTLMPNYSQVMQETAKATKDKSGLKNLSNVFKGVGSLMTLPMTGINLLMSFMEFLGIFEPIFEILSAVAEMFGGVLIEKLMPSIMGIMNAIWNSGLLDVIMQLADILGIVLEPIIKSVSIALMAMSPLWELLGRLMGTEGFQDIMLTLGKIIGTVMIVSFIPLIWIIYGVGVAISALMDVFMNIITLGTWGWQNTEAWNAQMGTMAVETTDALLKGVEELWAMELEPATGAESASYGDTYINVEVETNADPDQIAAELDKRIVLGR